MHRDRKTCETCLGRGVYATGAFVGDDEFDLAPIMATCPDCDPPELDDKARKRKKP